MMTTGVLLGPDFAGLVLPAELGTGLRIMVGMSVAVILFVISLVIALLYQRFALRRDLAGAVTRGVR